MIQTTPSKNAAGATQPADTYRDFLAGFSIGAGCQDADSEWSDYSRQLCDSAREMVESGGFNSGEVEGRLYADFCSRNASAE